MLLLSTVENDQDELKRLETDHVKILQTLNMNLYILKKCLFHNVAKVVNKVIPTH